MPWTDEVLDSLPYGVVLLDRDGTVLHANAPARQLVPSLATEAGGSCRDLFPCRAPGGPCHNGCLVARTAGDSKPTAEIRIDTAAGASPGALWVTASPLPGGRGAILHLRPGWRGDRRRRSEERGHGGPELRITALGRTRVEALEDSLDEDWLGQRSGQILKYLVCERSRVVMVDEIAEAIWPDSSRRAVDNARYAIHRLRTRLEPRRAAYDASAFVVSHGSGYALDLDRIWIDVDEFERTVEQGRAAVTRLDFDAATEHLDRAMGLYGGDFLADEPYADWADEERVRLVAMATGALRMLVTLARERGNAADAIRHLQRMTELEPLDSDIHRELVQALLDEGLRSEAKRRYDNFTHRLRRVLGEEPDFDLRSLSPGPRSRAS